MTTPIFPPTITPDFWWNPPQVQWCGCSDRGALFASVSVGRRTIAKRSHGRVEFVGDQKRLDRLIMISFTPNRSYLSQISPFVNLRGTSHDHTAGSCRLVIAQRANSHGNTECSTSSSSRSPILTRLRDFMEPLAQLFCRNFEIYHHCYRAAAVFLAQRPRGYKYPSDLISSPYPPPSPNLFISIYSSSIYHHGIVPPRRRLCNQ